VNKRGTPANLVGSHPGNTNALRYGVHSAKAICQLAADIEEELFGDFELSPTQRVAAHAVATDLAILQRIDLDLSERGIVDRKGEPRYLLGHRTRISRDMERWIAHLTTARNAGAYGGEGLLLKHGGEDGIPSLAELDRMIATLSQAIERERGEVRPR
jgi:hypothetical protein